MEHSADDFKLPKKEAMGWAGIYIGSDYQLRLRSRDMQFQEKSNWQWRGKQHAVSTVLIIKGPPFDIQGDRNYTI